MFSARAAGNENQGHEGAEGPGLFGADDAGDQGAVAGAGVVAVKGQVRQAVEGHGKGARRYHGNGQKNQGAARGQPPAARKLRPGVGQGEDGMLYLDHAADIAELAEGGGQGKAGRRQKTHAKFSLRVTKRGAARPQGFRKMYRRAAGPH